MSAVYHGVNGKITASGSVIGGCGNCEISMEKEISEYAAIGASTVEMAGGHRRINWSMENVWAGSRFMPILTSTGSDWNIIMEVTGGCIMVASGCMAGGGTWTMSAGEITTEKLTGRSIDVYASGVSLL